MKIKKKSDKLAKHIVEFGSPFAILEEIADLRYQVYCSEEQLPYNTLNNRMVDEFDPDSVSFLISAEEKNAGTIRMTPKTHAMLEIEAQDSEWKKLIEDKPLEHTFEINRFAVAKDYRGTIIPFDLMLNVLAYSLEHDLFHGFVAGKVGTLERFYTMIGGERLTQKSVVYKVNNSALGEYNLIYFNLKDLNIPKKLNSYRSRFR